MKAREEETAARINQRKEEREAARQEWKQKKKEITEDKYLYYEIENRYKKKFEVPELEKRKA